MKPFVSSEFAINGRFLSAGPTAVHLVAEELTRALLERPDHDDGILLVPQDARKIPGIPKRKCRRVRGNGSVFWEQVHLPLAAGRCQILSFCNKTPLISCNATAMIHDAQVFTHSASYSFAARHWGRLHAKVASRRQNSVFTVSQSAKEALVKATGCDAEHIKVVHCGVDHVLRTAPDEGVLERYQLEKGRFVLALANTQPHKNIALLLRAFSDPTLADMRLVLSGGASAGDFEASGTRVPANVIFPGYVTDAEMRALQKNALATCMPSLSEGFGLPPLEAMALGTPAIVSPKASLPEVCGDAALYADAHDPSDWVSAILNLLQSPDLRDRQVELGLRQSARFTWQNASAMVRASLQGSNAGNQR